MKFKKYNRIYPKYFISLYENVYYLPVIRMNLYRHGANKLIQWWKKKWGMY